LNFTQEYLVHFPERVHALYKRLGHSLDDAKRAGKELKIRCPFHRDTRPSLDVDVEQGGLFTCRSCHAEGDAVLFTAMVKKITEADAIAEMREFLGLQRAGGNGNDTTTTREPGVEALKEVFSDGNGSEKDDGGNGSASAKPKPIRRTEWKLHDRDGNHRATHIRLDFDDGKKQWKDCPWKLPDGTKGLGGMKRDDLWLFGVEDLPKSPGWSAILGEGEKVRDALKDRGFLAVATVTGASGTPSVKRLEDLRGCETLYIWPDHDDDNEGRDHMDRIAALLKEHGIVKEVRVLTWGEKDKDDAADFFERGGTAEQLDQMLSDAPEWAAPKPADEEKSMAEKLIITWDEFMAETFPKVISLWGLAFLVMGGGYLVLSGDTGVGKTILIINLILSLAEGRDEFLGFPLPGRPVRCLILEAEGSRKMFRDRIAAIADARGIKGSLPITFHKIDAELSIKNISKLVGQANAEFVFLDPVSNFWTGNENDASDWIGSIVQPLGAVATKHVCAVAFCDHYGKPNENRYGQFKLRGTAAKVQRGGAALRLEIGRGGAASRILTFDRIHDGPLPDPNRVALKIDVARGTVERDSDGVLEAVPDDPAEAREERRRQNNSDLAQQDLEQAFAKLERQKGFDPEAGISERDLATEAGRGRTGRPFKDGVAALKAQGVIELAPKGGWRRKKPS
jgi:hypothetical protein